jgi:hypothetical protein
MAKITYDFRNAPKIRVNNLFWFRFHVMSPAVCTFMATENILNRAVTAQSV